MRLCNSLRYNYTVFQIADSNFLIAQKTLHNRTGQRLYSGHKNFNTASHSESINIPVMVRL